MNWGNKERGWDKWMIIDQSAFLADVLCVNLLSLWGCWQWWVCVQEDRAISLLLPPPSSRPKLGTRLWSMRAPTPRTQRAWTSPWLWCARRQNSPSHTSLIFLFRITSLLCCLGRANGGDVHVIYGEPARPGSWLTINDGVVTLNGSFVVDGAGKRLWKRYHLEIMLTHFGHLRYYHLWLTRNRGVGNSVPVWQLDHHKLFYICRFVWTCNLVFSVQLAFALNIHTHHQDCG